MPAATPSGRRVTFDALPGSLPAGDWHLDWLLMPFARSAAERETFGPGAVGDS
jgi:hypothetical protein